MGLFMKGGMSGLLPGGLFGGGSVPAGYLKTLTQADLVDQASIATPDGKWTLLGEYVVPAQQVINVGYEHPDRKDNQGRVFLHVVDSTAVLALDKEGVLRIQVADANDVVKPGGVVLEERTEVLKENKTDRTKQVPLPEYPVAAGQDDKIQVWYKGETVGAELLFVDKPGAGANNTEFLVPCTVRRL